MPTYYPPYKDAAHKIFNNAKMFYSDNELSKMLTYSKNSKAYEFEKMNLINELLYNYQIDFIRSENEIEGKGYKKATDEESVNITIERLQRKMHKATARQRAVLNIVERSQLDLIGQQTYDSQIVRNALTTVFFRKTPLHKCVSGTKVKVDIPRLLPNKP